jgi:hypothetical protein
MKLFSMALLTLFSVSAFGSLNEIECHGKVSDKMFKVEVDRDTPGGPIFRPARLIIQDEVHEYSVTVRQPGGFNYYEYAAFGFRLEVDLTPHPYPRFGWTYKAGLLSRALDNQSIHGLKCRFPNAY